jgi:NO-binding membrane sensor protein with MHYT domain
MLTVHNFSYGLLTPGLSYTMSCLGAFLGLRCTTRARAYSGATRARWLLLSAVSIGATGIWVMHFIAMLGYTIPGQTILYNVPITILSMLIAVTVVCGGLFIVGFGRDSIGRLLIAGIVTGIGVASMHYTGMAALQVHARMTYNPALLALSVLIAIVAATAALWATLRLRGIWSTLGAALIMGVAVNGMHYTGMAAMHMFAVRTAAGMLMTGASATAFLLPLILGISILTFIVTATIALSPTDTEIHAEDDLMSRISAARATAQPPAPHLPPAASRRPVTAISRAAQARRQADSDKGLTAPAAAEGTSAGRSRPPRDAAGRNRPLPLAAGSLGECPACLTATCRTATATSAAGCCWSTGCRRNPPGSASVTPSARRGGSPPRPSSADARRNSSVTRPGCTRRKQRAADAAARLPSAPQRRRAARHRLSGRSPAIRNGSSHQAGTAVLLSA